MTDRMLEIRRRVGAGRDALAAQDDRSMRLLELGLAITALAVVVLLAVAPA